MGDGITTRYAVIINGDTEPRHLENVERAAARLREGGHRIAVASPEPPSGKIDAYEQGTAEGLSLLIDGIKGRIDDDDELVIYATGHGRNDRGGCLVLGDGCLPIYDKTFTELFALPAAKRTIVMSQCSSGNWVFPFLQKSEVLFMSPGSPDEEVSCDTFDPFLFAPTAEVPDRNRDGVIAWQERYAYALDHPQAATPQMLRGREHGDTGVGAIAATPRFSGNVIDIRSPDELQLLATSMLPGDVAVVVWSAPWCGICHAYRPSFESLAQKERGASPFVWIENGDDDLWGELRRTAFPTVTLVRSDGLTLHLEPADRVDPLARQEELLLMPPAGRLRDQNPTDLLASLERRAEQEALRRRVNVDRATALSAVINGTQIGLIDPVYLDGAFFRAIHRHIVRQQRSGSRSMLQQAKETLSEEQLRSLHTNDATALETIRMDANGIYLLSDRQLSDADFIFLAIRVMMVTHPKETGRLHALIGDDLRKDPTFLSHLPLKQDPQAIAYYPLLQQQKASRLAAIEGDAGSFLFADDALFDDLGFVRAVGEDLARLASGDNDRFLRSVCEQRILRRHRDRLGEGEHVLALIDAFPLFSDFTFLHDSPLKRDRAFLLRGIEKDARIAAIAEPALRNDESFRIDAILRLARANALRDKARHMPLWKLTNLLGITELDARDRVAAHLFLVDPKFRAALQAQMGIGRGELFFINRHYRRIDPSFRRFQDFINAWD